MDATCKAFQKWVFSEANWHWKIQLHQRNSVFCNENNQIFMLLFYLLHPKVCSKTERQNASSWHAHLVYLIKAPPQLCLSSDLLANPQNHKIYWAKTRVSQSVRHFTSLLSSARTSWWQGRMWPWAPPSLSPSAPTLPSAGTTSLTGSSAGSSSC